MNKLLLLVLDWLSPNWTTVGDKQELLHITALTAFEDVDYRNCKAWVLLQRSRAGRERTKITWGSFTWIRSADYFRRTCDIRD